ncbi:MAG: biotin/lipoyl-binding protein [Caulobacteraceae bacterium]|nr:biotin/lipoyl-binding protein [Caulobacteraceae bacterium]
MDAIATFDPSLEASDTKADAHRKSRRKRLLIGLSGAVAAALAGGFAYENVVSSRHATTDNAYVGADIAEVTPLVGGPVTQVLVEDTQAVKRGDILVRLDDTDARLALEHAEADLAATERKVRGLVDTDSSLRSQIVARSADEAQAAAKVASANADLAKAKIDLDRREALAASGSVSGDELTTARTAFQTATANLKAAQAAQALAAANQDSARSVEAANADQVKDSSVDQNPQVLAARAARDQAMVDLERTIIRAPIDGVVSRRQVQVGQKVQAGYTMMWVVPVQHAYVDANFKEGQLTKVRAGQSATLTSDLYGTKVKYHGHVVGFSGGTGAAFAVVPAQNATGNWIKVVQRLPVRIALDPQELAAHPLRVGLSMAVDVDVSK